MVLSIFPFLPLVNYSVFLRVVNYSMFDQLYFVRYDLAAKLTFIKLINQTSCLFVYSVMASGGRGLLTEDRFMLSCSSFGCFVDFVPYLL